MINMKIKIKRRTHDGYTEWLKGRKFFEENKMPRIFGRYQYIYSYCGVEISLVNLHGFHFMYKDMRKAFEEDNYWEIYQLKGATLFDDVEKFPTKQQADKAIRQYFKNLNKMEEKNGTNR